MRKSARPGLELQHRNYLREPRQVGAAVDHPHLDLHHRGGLVRLVLALGVLHRYLTIRRGRHEGELNAAVAGAAPELVTVRRGRGRRKSREVTGAHGS